MGKKSPPPAPDYTNVAKEQADGSQQLALQDTWANRADVSTPWGKQTWTNKAAVDPSTGKPVTQWSSEISLSPEQQRSLDSQQAIQQGRSDGAMQLLGQATSAFQQPMDWNSLPQRSGSVGLGQMADLNQIDGGVRNLDAAQSGPVHMTGGAIAPMSFGTQGTDYQRSVDGTQVQQNLTGTPDQWRGQAQKAALDFQKPMFDEQRAGLENQLANQGLARGSEAWDREMRRVDDAQARAGLQAFGEGRAEAGQLFQQDLAQGNFSNAAAGQQFQQNLNQGNFTNDAASREFQQNLAQGQFGNQAQQQFYQQTANNADIYNRGQQQDFQQQMTGRQFENQAQQQQFTNLMSLAERGDQQAIQALNAQIAAGQFNNTNRQQAVSEEQQRRAFTLNELNALLTGQQVSMPNMPSYNRATMGENANLMGAAQSQYSAGLDQSNANMQQFNNLMQGGLSAAMMFSDSRLKEDIRATGTSVAGVPVVHYRYRGLPGRYVGVIAQDVLRIKPRAAVLHPSGYLMVNYQELLQ